MTEEKEVAIKEEPALGRARALFKAGGLLQAANRAFRSAVSSPKLVSLGHWQGEGPPKEHRVGYESDLRVRH